jgi:AcrR family transcriptional regulator
MTSAGSLRERQAAVVRDEILDALARRLDREDPEDIAMPQVAADAGISLRTLYRYFPTREDMFEAVGDHVVARLGLPREIRSAELMRAMLWTRLGRRARSSHRRRRVESIATALAEVTSHLPAAEARRREGAVVYLASLPAWITVSEECGLSAEDAQRGIAWAIETLIAALRRDNQAHDARHLSQGGDHHDRDDSD